MNAIILVAASGLAREALVAARAQGHFDIVGIVDDDPARAGELIDGVKVLGGLDVIDDHPDASVLICAGQGAVREQLAQRLRLPDTRYAVVAHPSVEIPPTCTVGPGSILLAGTVLTTGVTLGRHVVVMPNVVLTHDDVVDDYATLCAGVVLGGGVRVGRRAYLGMSASIRENRLVGPGATVGMGSVVLTDVPGEEVWAGVPASELSFRETKATTS